MKSLDEIGVALEVEGVSASAMLALGEEALENWIEANGGVPTDSEKEGFRIIALHRQGAKGDPGFNACRETCRELAYHYNLIKLDPDHEETIQRLYMMKLVASHLYYFIAGKIEQSDFGEFCCSSRSVRAKLDN